MSREKLFTHALLTAGAIALLAALTVGGYIAWVTLECRYQVRHGPTLDRNLGFTYATPYFLIDGRLQEVMTLYPKVGGPMHRGGVTDDDIVVGEGSVVCSFYRKLESARGKQMRFSVVAGGDGPPLNKRPIRSITVDVPRPNQ